MQAAGRPIKADDEVSNVSSHFSSVLRQEHPVPFGQTNDNLDGAMSSSLSQISYEDGFPSAEVNAQLEEERAKVRDDIKKQKLEDFKR